MALERLHVYELNERHEVSGPGRAYRGVVCASGGPLAVGAQVRVRVVDADAAGGDEGLTLLVRAHGAARGAASEGVQAPADFGTLRGEAGLRFWSAVEWVPGRSLDAVLLECDHLPDEVTERLARELAAALGALHGTGLAGVALHPRAVLLRTDGSAVLLDVGFAPLDVRIQGAPDDLWPCLAPELHTDIAERGHASDLYALGAVLYRCAAGCFYDPDRAVDAAEPGSRRPSDLRHDASIFLSEVVHTLLDPRPTRRFTSANDLLQVLTARRRSAWWQSRHIDQESVFDDPALVLRDSREAPPPPITPPAPPPDDAWFAARHAPQLLGDARAARVGRGEHVSVLRAALEALTGGTGGRVVVRGPFGSGRTRLLDVVVEEASARGDVIALAAAFPRHGVGRPLGALSEALTQFIDADREVTATTVARLLGDSAGAAPAFAALLSSRTAPEGAEPLSLAMLSTCFARVFDTLCAQRPTVIVLDDVDRAGTPARRVLGALARLADRRPLLVVVSCASLPPDLAAVLANRVDVPVDALDAFGTLDLVRSVVGDPATANRIAPAVHRGARGRPRPVMEILNALADRDVLERLGGERFYAGESLSNDVPSSEQAAFGARLDALGPRSREALVAAALQGDRFDVDVTRRALGWTADEMDAVLRDLARAGLARGDGPARRFAVSAHTGLLTTGIAGRDLAAAHMRTADAFLASRNPDQMPPSELHGILAYRVAYHYLRGGNVGRGELYLPVALDHMRATWRLGEAERLARLASDLLRKAGRIADAIDLDLDRAAILNSSGDVESARDVLTAALCDAVRLEDERRAARLSLALARVAEDPMRAAEHAADALAAATEAGDRPAVGRAHLARGLARRDQRRHGDARHDLRRALEVARETRDQGLESRARRALGVVAVAAGWRDEADEHLRSALASARIAGDLRLETIALRGLARQALGDRDPVRGEQLLRRAIAVDRARGDGGSEALDLVALAEVVTAEGRVSDACELYGTAAYLAEVIEDAKLRARIHRLRGEVELRVGRFDAAAASLREAHSVTRASTDDEERGLVLLALGDFERQRGDTGAARSLLVRALESLERAESSAAAARASVALARVEILAGETEAGEVRLREALEVLGRSPVVAVAQSLRAVAAARSGLPDVVHARIDDTEHALTDVGDVLERIEALFRLSLALRVLGEGAEADERLLDAESALHRAARRLTEEDAETFMSSLSPGREIVAGAAHLRRRAAELAGAGSQEPQS